MSDLNKILSTEEFVRLLTRNERRVYAFILSLVSNWADADEIQQETNVKLWQEKDKYKPGTDFAAWACTVAKFEVLTYRKQRSREQVRFNEEFVIRVAEQAAVVMDTIDDRHQALSFCIEQLSETNQNILRETYRPGGSIKQVAIQFGRTVQAAYKALSRIRHFLHDCITHRLEGESQ